MTATISEIEAELARSRAALRSNLSALASRLTVRHVIGDVILTPGFVAGAAKVVAPFAIAGAAGLLLKHALKNDSVSAPPHMGSSMFRGMPSFPRGRRLQRESASRTLLMVLASVAAAGGAAAILPLTRREKKALARPLRFAAEQAAEVSRTVAAEAQAISEKAAAFAHVPANAPEAARVTLHPSGATVISAS